jgi:hypothetical protein
VRVELHLTPKDLDLVLVALGQLPYVQVHDLIGRIQAEAGPQLVAARAEQKKATDDIPASR